MIRLSVEGLAKAYGRGDDRVPAVDGVSFTVPEGSLLALLGPSGCGKTTILRCIAGLETPDAGEIVVAGRTVFSASRGGEVPPAGRGLGMVFQSYAIWPHMTVRENAAFLLEAKPRRTRAARGAIAARVTEVLEAVGLDRLADRPATALSGGEQQRLALARALVTAPAILLLDEPLSSLDAPLRERMRVELGRLQRELDLTCVYVTHDQTEALAIADEVAVVRDGRIEQVGTPHDVYERPATSFVAGFIGGANLIDGHVTEAGADGVHRVRTEGGELVARGTTRHPEGTRVVVVARPEHVGVAAIPPAVANGWRGRVEAAAFLGDSVDHHVRVAELSIRARGPVSGTVARGTEVALTFDPDACSLVPAEDEA